MNGDNLDLLVDRYLRHITVERGLSKNTLSAYNRDLGDYLVFLRRSGVTAVEQVTDLQIEGFIEQLSATRKASSGSYPCRGQGLAQIPIAGRHIGA